MDTNPFTSDTFKKIWSKHFNEGKASISFPGISGVDFVKPPFFPLYHNTGKNLTKGLEYRIDTSELMGLGHRVISIQDVILFEISEGSLAVPKRVKVLKINQYPGLLVDLSEFNSYEDYFQKHFKTSSRYKLRSHKNRLEDCFDITYTTFCGAISQEIYDHLFEQFRSLLEKRFKGKKVHNHNLDKPEWAFYSEVYYRLILEGKAALFVVFEQKKPIAITLLSIKGDTIIHTMTAFDTDYSKFRLGTCSNMQLVHWCIQNGYKKLDFSKGYYDYKARWSTQKYPFEYHVLYNPGSPISTVIAFSHFYFMNLKAFLRRKELNLFKHRLTYFFQNFPLLFRPKNNISQWSDHTPSREQKIDWEEISEANIDPGIKKELFDFLFFVKEKFKNVNLYQSRPEGLIKIRGQRTEKYLIRKN